MKIDCGILDSTIWVENPATCKVWITMLAMSNSDGICAATAPGISRRSNVPLADVRSAIEILEGPDPESRTVTDEGRRIRRVNGGYFIINYAEHRDRDHTAALRMRRYRENKRLQQLEIELRSNSVTQRNVTPTVTQGEAEGYTEREDLPLSLKSRDKGVVSASANRPPPCPHNEIIALYHEILPMLPHVRIWNEKRRKLLCQRWKEDRDRQDLAWWRGYFEDVAGSAFLTGKKDDRNGFPFWANLEWLCKPSNLIKVYEGNYQ